MVRSILKNAVLKGAAATVTFRRPALAHAFSSVQMKIFFNASLPPRQRNVKRTRSRDHPILVLRRWTPLGCKDHNQVFRVYDV